MSKAEELLYSIGEDDVYEGNGHIVINADRTITIPDELKSIAVQYDNNIETVTFDCPRYWDEHDFSTMSVFINYMRSDGHKGSFAATNLIIDKDDDTIIHFDWTISEDATLRAGKLPFLVCIQNNETDKYPHWNSRLCQDLIIEPGMEVYDHVIENGPGIVNEILSRLNSLEIDNTNLFGFAKDIEIVPELVLSADESGKFFIDAEPSIFVVGEKYIVTWNGLEYLVTAIDGTEFAGEEAVLLINSGADFKTSENMKFAILYRMFDNTIELIGVSGATSLTFSVHQANLATKSYVRDYVNTQLGVIENGYY